MLVQLTTDLIEINGYSTCNIFGRFPNNEDLVGVWPELGLAVVVDGTGSGEYIGVVCLGILKQAVVAMLVQSELTDEQAMAGLHAAFQDCNQVAKAIEQHKRELRGACASVGVVWVLPTMVVVAHIGDVRVYEWDGSGLQRLTKDHVLSGSYYETSAGPTVHNELPPNVLLRAVGQGSSCSPTIVVRQYARSSKFVLCSKGVYDTLSEDTFTEFVRNHLEWSGPDFVQELTLLSIEQGSKTNISCALVSIASGSTLSTKRSKSAGETAELHLPEEVYEYWENLVIAQRIPVTWLGNNRHQFLPGIANALTMNCNDEELRSVYTKLLRAGTIVQSITRLSNHTQQLTYQVPHAIAHTTMHCAKVEKYASIMVTIEQLVSELVHRLRPFGIANATNIIWNLDSKPLRETTERFTSQHWIATDAFPLRLFVETKALPSKVVNRRASRVSALNPLLKELFSGEYYWTDNQYNAVGPTVIVAADRCLFKDQPSPFSPLIEIVALGAELELITPFGVVIHLPD